MSETINLLLVATWQTIYMVAVSTFIATIFGVPLGILLMVTDRNQILQNELLNKILGTIVNIFRSVPFVILLIVLIPFTRLLVGKAIGTTAAIVPLSVAAIPFMGRLTETALREVDRGIIEAAQSMGASPLQIITKVLVPEALPSIAAGITITTINLVGYSAMAGVIGGGGLGDLAVRYGYQRFMLDIMLYTVAILVAMVQLIQLIGDVLVKQLSKNR
ncbi:MAG: Binding-protein-dependent transport systems inner membrane component [Caldanaerobacter subterraneus]|jgi:D-methionine transport system permease protein|uniref:Binding-protein-dependent transport systems inner membrane component n=2 Tax=Thermoanaerobacter TaxID=1754 RepID=B0KA24_THEP3|nr:MULTISPECIES: methionine ABC transporter permease [Thermoanaerobacter]KUK34906.1 MAG: Binding-protein-dependent transport systems inner membrane component [Caldanaerobacter subterraneus]ABY93056.1 binding-protein-dependent transport systems inner membrane component [Thermoanaerobacter sp. X514]ABY94987.1 binding-protein-dependent transport systems inner membrane component [Thermoanaerobacter pseudethanolicus ATCC 33223]ADV79936.1 binding-protein-dependent transport systems inner membrane com